VPPIPSGNAEVQVVFDLPGQAIDDAVIVYGIATPAPGLGDANGIFIVWRDRVMPILSAEGFLQRVTVTDDTGNTYDSVEPPEQGGDGRGTNPPQVAVLVKKLAALGGRHNRGRMYVPLSYNGSFNSDGSMDSGALADYQAAFNDLYDDHASNGWDIEILHADATTPTAVTALQVSSLIATQRRRGPRG
jgi:hypothetical protein